MMMMLQMFMMNSSYMGPNLNGTSAYSTGSSPAPASTGSGGTTTTTVVEEVIEEYEEIEVGGDAETWGDPHFVGADGGKFDVMGEVGKTYNILSDKDFQMNARFDEWKGKDNQTIMSDVGFTLGEDQVQFGIDGKLIINGEERSEDGEYLNGKIRKEGDKVYVETDEWQLEVHDNKKGHIDVKYKGKNVTEDGVKPHGLFGQTADGDGKARNGDEGKGAQGGGAIEDTDGNITERGDKETYKDYEQKNRF